MHVRKNIGQDNEEGQHRGKQDYGSLFLRTMRYSLRRAESLDSVDGCTPVESRGVSRLESMNLRNALSSLWVGHRPMGTHNPKVGGSNPPPATNAIIGLQAELLFIAGAKRGTYY
jgi:hypothetical protein